VVLFAVLITLASCGPSAAQEHTPGLSATAVARDPRPETLTRVAYSAESPFNQKIPPNAKIDPNSPALVQSLVRDARERGIYIVVNKWTVPVYYADAETPRYDVTLTASWAGEFASTMAGTPIPEWARPDPENDGSMVVVDRSTNCEYDFWQAVKRDGHWHAAWANNISIEGTGVYPQGLSARGSGFALLAGTIWPDELERGRIEHALLFSYNFTRSGGPVWPATESDGESTDSGAIPEGARIQLDPSLDLDSLDLTPYEKTIAKALQEYGMILGDNSGGGISFYAIHPMSARYDPYRDLLPLPDPQDGYVPLFNLPVEKFRVLTLGSQDPNPKIALIPTACARMK
ncbi:MAG: hypothetical protein AB1750_19810, partial [Chloroflexota bacterium]